MIRFGVLRCKILQKSKKINNCSYFSMLSLKELNKFHMKVGKKQTQKRNLCKDRKSDLREAEGITQRLPDFSA